MRMTSIVFAFQRVNEFKRDKEKYMFKHTHFSSWLITGHSCGPH